MGTDLDRLVESTADSVPEGKTALAMIDTADGLEIDTRFEIAVGGAFALGQRIGQSDRNGGIASETLRFQQTE